MTSAWEYLQPLNQGLIPVPAIQLGVCRVCRGACNGVRFDTCFSCRSHPSSFSVIPISLSVHFELLHFHLRRFKDGPERNRPKLTLRLAALLEIFLANHLETCLGGPVDFVATVPSGNRDAAWSIVERLQRFDGFSNPLSFGPLEGTLSARHVRGRRVLLIDDTFTTGATLLRAQQAVIDAGGQVVGPLVLGRHMRRGWRPCDELLKRLSEFHWDPTKCCICSGISINPPLTDRLIELDE